MTGAPFIIYLAKATAIAAMGLLYYTLLLRKRKTYAYNRLFLVCSVLVSITLPWFQFSGFIPAGVQLPVLPAALHNVGYSSEVDQMAAAVPVHRLGSAGLFLIAYCCVSVYLLGSTLAAILRVIGLVRRHKAARYRGVWLIKVAGAEAPFSFFNFLFWNERIPMDSEDGQRIWRHERTHIRLHHSLDKLLLQLVLCIAWVNPCYWIIRRELALQHEFIADEAAVTDGDTEAFARMLLAAHHPRISTLVSQSFFHSPIKRRLSMIMQPTGKKWTLLRKWMAAPLLLTATVLFAFDGSKTPAVVRADHPIVLALDAAHGGSDAGAESINGLKEKDLTLALSQRISALAGAYNIRVVNSRTADESSSLDERVSRVNSSGADLYLGLHVNKLVMPGTPAGYDLLVGRNYKTEPVVQQLAAAVKNSFATTGIHLEVKEAGLKMLRDVRMPGVVIECGNIDNEAQMAHLTDPEKRDAFCRQLLTAIVAYEHAGKR